MPLCVIVVRLMVRMMFDVRMEKKKVEERRRIISRQRDQAEGDGGNRQSDKGSR